MRKHLNQFGKIGIKSSVEANAFLISLFFKVKLHLVIQTRLFRISAVLNYSSFQMLFLVVKVLHCI